MGTAWITGWTLLLTVLACGGRAVDVPPGIEAPAPSVLQYAGQYAGSGSERVELHVDGSFDATLGGAGMRGSFAGESSARGAELTLRPLTGAPFSMRLALAQGSGPGPPRVEGSLRRAEPARFDTLWPPWVAGNEGMCEATGGEWRDDDADPTTGLFCVCARGSLYLPSRGGCVSRAQSGQDPARQPPSEAARRLAGRRFVGTGRVTLVGLATDGALEVTMDGLTEPGAWWDATYAAAVPGGPVRIACTAVTRALVATLTPGSLAVELPVGEIETLTPAP